MDSSKKIQNTKEETYSLFSLPQEILESLKIYSEQIEIINSNSLPTINKLVSEDESDIDSIEDSSHSESRKNFRCNKCKLSFNNDQELRDHCHSEQHIKNILKSINNEEISDEEFNSKISLDGNSIIII
ncbi:hypothetical protein BCR36DRAFT_336707 [Piromyces finnis]|uniref:C2H2-type domain-containing protein n=1 Tax=Piromyces finnis TaxID=1754191 RepID=A0A1Y1UXK2_9FUNG|nr:hypothetical protein BCR36DRAFT_336707 [Piromyces finnis]|eukprot:ORX42999.1 hypothetical protein BCR36DRAFT_336707 [Piromyces finnis]